MRVLVKGTTEARLGLAAPAELLVGAWTLLVDDVPFDRGMAIRSRADFLQTTGTRITPALANLQGLAHTEPCNLRGFLRLNEEGRQQQNCKKLLVENALFKHGRHLRSAECCSINIKAITLVMFQLSHKQDIYLGPASSEEAGEANLGACTGVAFAPLFKATNLRVAVLVG